MRKTLLMSLLPLVALTVLVFAAGLLYASETPGGAAVAGKDSVKAAGHAYLGITKCKMCHMPYFKAWALTPHATAFDRLKPANKEDKNPKCFKCHTTGFGSGGFDLAKTTPDFKNVQCEACHGAGADYMKIAIMKDVTKARAAGLVFPVPETVCVKCHNKESPNFKGFDYAKYLAKGVHKVEKATTTTK